MGIVKYVEPKAINASRKIIPNFVKREMRPVESGENVTLIK
jgi:hypothetical protein